MPYLAGVGRTPRVAILAKVQRGPEGGDTRLLVLEMERGNPFDISKGYQEGYPPEPYFVYARNVYAQLQSGSNPWRYTLSGEPDLKHVRTLKSEAAYWEEE